MPVPGSTFILGFAVRYGGLASAADLVQFREGGSARTVHIAVTINSSGFLVVKRGSTVLATATTNAFLPSSWYYFEIKVVIHDTLGSVVCHLDGVNVSFSTPLTGIDTRNGGTGIVDTFRIDGQSTSPYMMVDDLYLCDATGTTNNDFLGNCVVESLLPQVGNGDLTGLTPSTGTDHGAMVDDNPPTDDTDYNSGDTIGQTDCYNYPSLALTGSILGVQTNLYTRKTDAGARTVAATVRLGGTSLLGRGGRAADDLPVAQRGTRYQPGDRPGVDLRRHHGAAGGHEDRELAAWR